MQTQLHATYATHFKQIGGNVIFSTALYAVIDTRTGLMRCANASHPRPFILRRSEGAVEQLSFSRAGRGTALGIFPDSQYATSEVQLRPNDLLLLYTDGLSEVENPSGDLYDTRRFQEALAALLPRAAAELLDGLVDDAKAFSGKEDFEDDVCLVAIEVARLSTGAS